MDRKTQIRLIEGWIVTFVATFGAQITVGGQPVDLNTNTGRVAAASGIVSAVLLAIRRVVAAP